MACGAASRGSRTWAIWPRWRCSARSSSRCRLEYFAGSNAMHALIALMTALAVLVQAQPPRGEQPRMLLPPELPATHFVTSKDGTKIAYDVTGQGPVVILL